MGSFLDKPKTEKETMRVEGLGLRCAVCSMQGWRIDQEDAHVAKIGLDNHPTMCWFGVFDGHGGSLVSNESAKRLLPKIDLSSSEPGKLKTTIRTAFLELDAELRKLPAVSRGDDHSGSTAVTAMMTETDIICGNCGDSRAILVRDSKAVALSEDHKPYNPAEMERIVRAGGTVTMRRVNGDLAVSRALGDFVYKHVTDLPDVEQQVSAEPEFVVERRDAAKDQFLVLACDGIWDVMTNEEVAQYILDTTAAGVEDLGELAAALIDTCLAKGSRDNMSVVLVAFPNAPRPTAEAVEKYQAAKAREAAEAAAAGDDDDDNDNDGGAAGAAGH